MDKNLVNYLLADETKNVFHIAQQIAKENVHPSFGPAHLLKALLHKDAGMIPLLKSLDKDYYYIEEWAEVRLEEYERKAPVGDPAGDDAIPGILAEADDVRFKLQKEQVDVLSLFAAVITPGVGFSFDQLKSFVLKRDELISTDLNNTLMSELLGVNGKSGTAEDGANKSTGALFKYCTDKTEKAIAGKIDEIVGRDNELRMVAEVLCRRSKPNVMLVGEPGVGKTALADGFALAVVQKKVPDILLNAQVFELDNGALIAGASYKGEIEDRLKNIMTEIKKFDKAILFIDEIHTLTDKHGSAAGAANILKPALARGEITVIGATTLEEYKKHIENDEALNRRFELITIDEPDETTAFRMLKKVMPAYEEHHHITVDDDVKKEAIRLAKRYIKDRRLPDAAIDLLDRSLAALHMLNETGIQDVKNLSDTIEEWKAIKEEDGEKNIEDWKWLCRSFTSRISPILSSQVSSEVNPQIADTKQAVIDYMDELVTGLTTSAGTVRKNLLKTDIAAIVSDKTGIPLGKLQAQEQERLLNMEEILKKRVVGQDHAIKAISEAILESRSGLGKPGQPIGSFFFLGPTGTGKTELAKSLAEFLFQDESFMIRFDMSEFKEEHSAALLYGAPPGYVGYEEGGLLVNKIRRQPYAIVLFDEIEKAHTSVFDVFLQIMDEGKLHDKLGKTGDFSNAVVIFTSNIGSSFVVDKFNNNEIPTSNQLIDIMANHFRPEFLGRLTEVVPFAPVKLETVRGILNIQLKSLFSALDKQGISLEISDDAKDELARQGFTPAYGARPLGGVIRSQVRRPLSKMIIRGDIGHGSTVQLTLESGALKWNIAGTS
jgi:ATP-dependent Clp protease ATP-binding subunit ClpB